MAHEPGQDLRVQTRRQTGMPISSRLTSSALSCGTIAIVALRV
jgi:hypothetical protein